MKFNQNICLVVLLFLFHKALAQTTPNLTVYADDNLNGEQKDLSLEGMHYDIPWIDLKLPSGTLWATMDIGASSPYVSGTRYDAVPTLTGSWKLPSESQCQELINNCTWEVVYKGSTPYYYKVTSKSNGNSIYLSIFQDRSYGYSPRGRWTSRSGMSFDTWCTSSSYSCYYELANHAIYESPIRPTCKGLNDIKYTLNLCTQNGSKTNTYTCYKKQEVIINAAAEDNVFFMMWSDGNRDNPRTISITQDTILTAIFSSDCEPQATVNCTVVNESPYGTVSFTGTVIKNSNISLKATAPECSKFVRWSDNDTSNPRSLTVTQDSTLTAIFEKIQFNVSIDTNDPKKGKVKIE